MSYGKQKTTVEEDFKYWFERHLKREQRQMNLTDGAFAEHLGISAESLYDYYNKGTIPASTTLIKIISKCSIEFLADIIATAGLHDKYSIISTEAYNKLLAPKVENASVETKVFVGTVRGRSN